MQNAFLYWWQVVKIAFLKTAEFLGWGHIARWPQSILAVCIASMFYWWMAGDTKIPTEKMIWAVYVMAGMGTVFVAVFTFIILATPPRLAAEATAEFHRTISGLDSHILQLSSATDDATKSVLEKINDLIGETNAIHEAIKKASVDKDFFSIRNHIDDWENRAKGFVRQSFPNYVELFMSDAGLDDGTVYRGNPVASSLRKRLERRVVRLSSLMALSKSSEADKYWKSEDGVSL